MVFCFISNGQIEVYKGLSKSDSENKMLKSVALAITALTVPIHATKFNFNDFFADKKRSKPV